MTQEIQYLDFENTVRDVAKRIEELKALRERQGVEELDLPEKNLDEEIERLELKNARVLRRIYRNLEPWQKVQVARHPQRPQAVDYVQALIEDFQPLSGDRQFADDPTMLAGVGRFEGRPVVVLGTQKGKNTRERMKFNFGMPKPEGYRKAKRFMEFADKFKLPIFTFVDTPGAFPGVDAEARGQSEAIASCIETLMKVKVPVISLVTGEGGSGGALAVAVANKVLMLEHSIYSVISPEGCASILWRSATEAPTAAAALRLTADDLLKFGVIDAVIKEPVGGAQRNPKLVMDRTRRTLKELLAELDKEKHLSTLRREKFIAMTRG